MIKSMDFLTEKESEECVKTLFQLKDDWVFRGPLFYTLGTALYLDAVSEFGSYQIKAMEVNKVLKKHFPLLYSRLQLKLEEELKKKVVFSKQLSLPGFHIFYAPQNELETIFMKQSPPSIHFDLQFEKTPFISKNIKKDQLISFTVAFKLPLKGGGLNYWDIVYADYDNLSKADQEKLFLSKEKHYCPYQEGKIVIHNGFTLHQISISETYDLDDMRITLQGHAVLENEVWTVYW